MNRISPNVALVCATILASVALVCACFKDFRRYEAKRIADTYNFIVCDTRTGVYYASNGTKHDRPNAVIEHRVIEHRGVEKRCAGNEAPHHQSYGTSN